MKLIIITLLLTGCALLLTGCAAKFIPQHTMQARLVHVYRVSNSRAILTLVNTKGNTIVVRHYQRGMGKARYTINDWYTIRYTDKDSTQWCMAVIKRNQ